MQIPQDTVDTINFVAAIASLVLAVLAMALSLVFFWWSLKWAQESSRAADRINASVAKLEELFGRLYSDTFTVMRETMADVRKHAWRDSPEVANETKAEIAKVADSQLNKVRSDLLTEISDLLAEREGKAQTTTAQLKEIEQFVNNAIDRTRAAEARAKQASLEKATADFIKRHNDLTGGYPSYEEIIKELGYYWSEADIMAAIDQMRASGFIEELPMQAGNQGRARRVGLGGHEPMSFPPKH